MAAAFPGVSKIKFEGPQSKNPLAFRHYDSDAKVEGKSMRDHLRFSVAYWHTMRGTGSDPFGPGTMILPRESGDDPLPPRSTSQAAGGGGWTAIPSPPTPRRGGALPF